MHRASDFYPEEIQTQLLLEEEMIKDNIRQELPGNSGDCFCLQSVPQITPTAFVFSKKKKNYFRSNVQRLDKLVTEEIL